MLEARPQAMPRIGDDAAHRGRCGDIVEAERQRRRGRPAGARRAGGLVEICFAPEKEPTSIRHRNYGRQYLGTRAGRQPSLAGTASGETLDRCP